MSICGYSGTGKTTLICKLLRSLSEDYKVGYVKHDAHHFDMDKAGKDTYLAREHGATAVCIYNESKNKSALLGALNEDAITAQFNDYDCVLIEGLKHQEGIPKIVMLGEDSAILSEVSEDDILLTIRPDQRDDIHRVQTAIMETFQKKSASIPLNGLILTGGFSKRMGEDKAFITYSEHPQYQHVLDMVSVHCDNAYVSCREEQRLLFSSSIPLIPDSFIGMGPLGGILSAQKEVSDAAWLVIACDLPYLSNGTLDYLVENRHPYKLATAFKNSHNDLPEPLCTIYEPKSYNRHLSWVAKQKYCPRKILINSDTHLLDAPEKQALDNINTQEERKKMLKESVV